MTDPAHHDLLELTRCIGQLHQQLLELAEEGWNDHSHCNRHDQQKAKKAEAQRQWPLNRPASANGPHNCADRHGQNHSGKQMDQNLTETPEQKPGCQQCRKSEPVLKFHPSVPSSLESLSPEFCE